MAPPASRRALSASTLSARVQHQQAVDLREITEGQFHSCDVHEQPIAAPHCRLLRAVGEPRGGVGTTFRHRHTSFIRGHV
jgi:hypothetical protein